MSEILSDYLGARLATIREALGLKQSEIGKALDCSNGAYSLYERNKRQPTLSVLLNLCSKFGVSIDYLLGNLSPSPDIFADRLLKVLDKRNDKNLKEFVKTTGLDESSAKLLISGCCFPNAKTLQNLCKYLNCSSDYLIGLSNNTDAPELIPAPIPKSFKQRDLLDDLLPQYQNDALSYIEFLRQKQAAEQTQNKNQA